MPKQGERAGKLLAHKIKQFRAQNVITILSIQNQLITGKGEIKYFGTFTRNFIQPKGWSLQTSMGIFFSTLESHISSSNRDILEKEISAQEVKDAMKDI